MQDNGLALYTLRKSLAKWIMSIEMRVYFVRGFWRLWGKSSY